MKKATLYLLLIFLAHLAGPAVYAGSEMQKEKKKKDKEPVVAATGNANLLIDAKKEALIGNLKLAHEKFSSYVSRYPNDPAGLFELSRLEVLMDNSDEAIRLCREAVRLDPGNKWYSLFLADLVQGTSYNREAIAIYQKLVEQEPDNVDYLYQMAALYLQDEKYQDAIRIYNRIEESTGISEEISIQKEKIWLHLKDVKAAEKELLNLVAAFPGESRYLSILAEFYMASNQEEKALATYKSISEMDPENAYIHMSLADYYRKKGDKTKSFEELKLGFANPNLDVDSKINILLAFYTVNQIYNDMKEQGFTLSKILMETHPKDPKVYSIYGDFLLQDKKYSEARETFLKVLSLDSSRYPIWEQVLQLDLQLNELEHLRVYSKKTTELFPEQPLPYLFAGIANLQLKLNEDAYQMLNYGANLVVDNDDLLAQFYMYKADALHALKREPEAFAFYEKSLNLNDSNAYVLNNYAYYLSVKGQELDKAERMAKKAVTLDPDNPSFQDTYGWIFFMQGNYPAAREWILKAITNPAEEPSAEVLEHYGDVLYKLGDTASAIEYWIKAKSKGPGSPTLDKKIADKKYYQ